MLVICATLHTAECLGLQALFGVEQGERLLVFSVEHCFKRALSKTLCLKGLIQLHILVWHSTLSSVISVS